MKALEVEDEDKLRGLMNGILNGVAIPKEWNGARVKLLHKRGRCEDLKNYRSIAISSAICKLCILIVKEMINVMAEDSCLLGDVRVASGNGNVHRTTFFVLERLIEMVKRRNEEFFVVFMDMEKACDRVNRKKLFELMRGYGVHENLVGPIKRIYDGSIWLNLKCTL